MKLNLCNNENKLEFGSVPLGWIKERCFSIYRTSYVERKMQYIEQRHDTGSSTGGTEAVDEESPFSLSLRFLRTSSASILPTSP